jgi:hypothetical protein
VILVMSKEVLIACEFSGIVRNAFRKKGFDAWSCDIRETENHPQHHFQENVKQIIKKYDWDLMIAHPPCTYLSNSGVRWLYENEDRWQKMIDGAVFFRELLNSDIEHIAVENPIMHKWAKKVIGRDYDDSIQPYDFGHPVSKRTCFWLKNLPELQPTNVLEKKGDTWRNQTPSGQNKLGPSDDRSKERSRFWPGVADAMADQWGDVLK